jgi:hypothetical protein
MLSGGVKTNFDSPVGWDGVCDEGQSISAGKLCGGVPCVRSITISPPVITEQPCKAVTIGDPEQPPPRVWYGGPETPVGRACLSNKPTPSCADQAGACFPGGPAFSACIMSEGELDCPEGWGERHLLYGNVEDARECTACSCGLPSGGTCGVYATVFGVADCSQPKVAVEVSAGMMEPCLDVMPGEPFAAKSAELLAYVKGTCTPNGGEVMGELLVEQPATVCCYTPVI